MVATLAWKDQGLVLHFWPGFFLATHGKTPGGPGSSSQSYPKVQFHSTTAITASLVMSARVQEIIPSLLLKPCPEAGHCLCGCTGTSRQGSELDQRRRWAPTSSAAEDPCGSVCSPVPPGCLLRTSSLPGNCKAKSCPVFCSALSVRLRAAEG